MGLWYKLINPSLRRALSTALFLWVASAAYGEDYHTMPFPPAHELFAPLLADPSELKFGFEFGFPVGHHDVANIDAGDYLGVYRWALGGVGAMQLSVGGAINSRFDATTAHNLQVIDYYGNVPLDLRIGSFSARSMFYHDSSHLGDDYLREKGIQDQNNSWNAFREIISFQPWKPIRLYGGYTWAVNTLPEWKGRQAAQGGVEIYFNPSENAFFHPYWGNDVQSWERSSWNATWTSQLGVTTGSETSKGRGISYFVQFMTGPRYEGQFYTNRETIWGVGLKFRLSQALLSPAQKPEPPPLSSTAVPSTEPPTPPVTPTP
jgi:hypothetical protein